jgi:hypothetical protein
MLLVGVGNATARGQFPEAGQAISRSWKSIFRDGSPHHPSLEIHFQGRVTASPASANYLLFSRGGWWLQPPLEMSFTLNFFTFSYQIFKMGFSINPFRSNTQITLYMPWNYITNSDLNKERVRVHPCRCSYNSASLYINTLGLKLLQYYKFKSIRKGNGTTMHITHSCSSDPLL